MKPRAFDKTVVCQLVHLLLKNCLLNTATNSRIVIFCLNFEDVWHKRSLRVSLCTWKDQILRIRFSMSKTQLYKTGGVLKYYLNWKKLGRRTFSEPGFFGLVSTLMMTLGSANLMRFFLIAKCFVAQVVIFSLRLRRGCKYIQITRMHSSRMRTVRSSGRISGGVYLVLGGWTWSQGGLPGPGGVYLVLGGCLLPGGGVCSSSGVPGQVLPPPPLWTDTRL